MHCMMLGLADVIKFPFKDDVVSVVVIAYGAGGMCRHFTLKCSCGITE